MTEMAFGCPNCNSDLLSSGPQRFNGQVVFLVKFHCGHVYNHETGETLERCSGVNYREGLDVVCGDKDPEEFRRSTLSRIRRAEDLS